MSTGPPADPTELEYLADDAGLASEALRDYLRAEIERGQQAGAESLVVPALPATSVLGSRT